MTVPSTSVVICTRRREAQLTRCLDAMGLLAPPADEILVVDNTPGDTATRRAAAAAGTRYVVEPRGGVSTARNTGALAARCDLVVFIDDDAVPDSDWVGHHAAAFDDTSVGAATGRVLPEGSTEVSPAGTHEGDMGTEAFTLGPSSPDWFERTHFGGVGIGANMVFRRALFDRGWRFDEALGVSTPIPGGEEHLAFADVIRHGLAVGYVPQAIVRHGQAAPTRKAVRRRQRRMLRASATYAVMLMVEQPETRRRVLRYYVDLAKRRRADRSGSAAIGALHAVGIFVALAGAPGWYVAARLRAPRRRWQAQTRGTQPT